MLARLQRRMAPERQEPEKSAAACLHRFDSCPFHISAPVEHHAAHAHAITDVLVDRVLRISRHDFPSMMRSNGLELSPLSEASRVV
jgi:hypothetical protein